MYDPAKPGIGENRLYAVQSLIQAKIPDLNTCLKQDAYTSGLVAAQYGGDLTTSIVEIGQTEVLWDSKNGLIRIRVRSGGGRTGLDFEGKIEYVDMARKSYTFHTFIGMFLHPHAYKVTQGSDPVAQAMKREIARERMSDWLRNTLNNQEYNACTQLTLPSKEFHSATDTNTDVLGRCFATQGYKDEMKAGAGGDEVLMGIYMVHVGVIM